MSNNDGNNGDQYGTLLGRNNKREQPMFTSKAHVFHIDPMTKRSWVPASATSVPVSFFYDSARGLYRIISVEGTKAVINSTVTPGMNFTKTSQKFGQWSDVRANTVYGLGFPSEAELNKFFDHFHETKEASLRTSASSTMAKQVHTSTATAHIIPPPSLTASPLLQRNQQQNNLLSGLQTQSALLNSAASSLLQNNNHNNETYDDLLNDPNANTMKTLTIMGSPLLSKCPGLGGIIDSPTKQQQQQHGLKSPEAQLKFENERLRLALAQSSSNAKKWEIELSTLKTNNARLTSALQESTTNVEEWKRQLQAYKEENLRLKQRTLDAEAARGDANAAAEIRQEIGILRESVEYLSQTLKLKDEELHGLQQASSPNNNNSSDSDKENAMLRATLQQVQEQLETALGTSESQKKVLEALNAQLSAKIQDLSGIQREFVKIF